MPGIPPNALPMLKRVVKGLFKRDKTDKVDRRQGKTTVAPPAESQKVSTQPDVQSQKPGVPAATMVGASTAAAASTDQKTLSSTPGQAPIGSDAVVPAAGAGAGAIVAAHPKEDVSETEVTQKSTDQPTPPPKGSAAESAPATEALPAPSSALPGSVIEAHTENSLESSAPKVTKSNASADFAPAHGVVTDGPSTTTTSTTAPTTSAPASSLPAAVEDQTPKERSVEGTEKEQTTSSGGAAAAAPSASSARAPGMSATSGPLEDFVAVEGVE